MRVADILAKTAGWNAERQELVNALEKAQAALEKFDQKIAAEMAKLQPDKPKDAPIQVEAHKRGRPRKTTTPEPASQPLPSDGDSEGTDPVGDELSKQVAKTMGDPRD